MLREAELELIRQDVGEVLKSPRSASFLLQRFQQFDQLEEERKLLLKGQIEVKLPREQQRIYLDRIRDLEGEMTGLQCIAQAVRLGYEPYTLPNNYYVAEFDRRIGGIDGFLLNNWARRTAEAGFVVGPPLIGALLAGGEGFRVGMVAAIITGPAGVGLGEAVGSMTREERNDLGLEFKAPIPAQVLPRYQKARDTKLFERFLIASPNFDLFEQTRTSTLFADPVLVGYTRENANQPVSFTAKNGRRIQWKDNRGADIINGVGFLIAHWDLAKDRRAAGLNF